VKKILGSQRKSVEIVIGDQLLVLKEPSMRATNEMLEAVFDPDVLASVGDLGALLATLPGKDSTLSFGQWAMENLAGVFSVLRGAVLPLLTKKAGDVAVIALDVKENRERLGLTSSALREMVAEELTLTQAFDVLLTLKESDVWAELGKKLMALLPTLTAPVESETETAASEPSSQT
jgi:hypothetical protein